MKRQNLKTPIIMLAFNRSELPEADKTYANHVLTSYPFKQIQGHYNGSSEPAYIISLATHLIERERQILELLSLGRKHSQECILYSDEYRDTWLIDCKTSTRTPIGKLSQITEQQTKQLNSFTVDRSNNTYWAAQ